MESGVEDGLGPIAVYSLNTFWRNLTSKCDSICLCHAPEPRAVEERGNNIALVDSELNCSG